MTKHYYSVKNWEKYQTLQHGQSAPWFKLYTSVLDDPDVIRWPLTTLATYVMLLALRSRTGENLPTDHRLLAQMLATSGNKRRHVLSAVSQLVADGFLVLTNQQNGAKNSGAEKSRAEVD